MELHSNFGLGLPSPVNPLEDGGALGFPAVGLGAEVVVSQVDVDRRYQLADTGEAALAHDVVGELAEEAFDQVHPRGAGGSEMNVNPGMFFEPGADHGALVG